MSQLRPEESKKPAGNFFSFLLWWKIDEEELRKQVEQYDALTVTQSARGQSLLCFLIAAGITVLFIIFFTHDLSGLLDVILFLVLGFYVFKGQGWAMVAAMALWTIEKLLMIFNNAIANGITVNPFIQVMWWAIFMHYFYLAFRVEKARRAETRVNTGDKQ
jgi:hypothetical protein